MGEDNNSLRRSDDRRKGLKQFSDVKQVKRKSPSGMWHWIATMFFSGRSLKEVMMDVVEHEVVPNVKDSVRNSAVSILDGVIYKDRKPGPSASSTPGSFITNYVSYGDKKKQQTAALEANKKKEEETVKSGYECPAFISRDRALEFLTEMHNYVNRYETMSVQDLAWMQNKSVDYTWDRWGWVRDEIMAIREPSRFSPPVTIQDEKGNYIKLTHYIDLPKAHELD